MFSTLAKLLAVEMHWLSSSLTVTCLVGGAELKGCVSSGRTAQTNGVFCTAARHTLTVFYWPALYSVCVCERERTPPLK